MQKVHVSQDEYGFWFISVEEPDGTMKLVAHHYVSQEPAVEDAQDLMKRLSEKQQKKAHQESVIAASADTTVPPALVVDAPVRESPKRSSEWPDDYQKPTPRKAGQ